MELILKQTLAAVAGTFAFSLLYGIPRRYDFYCGAIGGAGWLLYALLTQAADLPAPGATFFAAVLLSFLSRCAAVIEKCPVTIFQTAGIFPLVPGAGIYWTCYYLVEGRAELAAEHGFAALQAAVAIVLGIIVVAELPNSLFNFLFGRRAGRERIR